MKLRTRKQLLNVATVGLLCVSGYTVFAALAPDSPDSDLELISLVSSKQVDLEFQQPSSEVLVDRNAVCWQKKLLDPLFDPPPVPVVVVKPTPRPVTVKLMGTILEPENSQAFVKLPSGSVKLKRIGDQVSEDPLDGTIKAITANEILIQRQDDEVRLQVQIGN